MKRKRSVRMITKLLILSLILGLCLPSFTYQVNAAWLDDGYGLNGPRYINSETHQPDPSMGYIYNDESSEIKFNTVQPSTLGFEKYIMFYEANQGGDWTKDYGFFSEINIPLQSTESDSNKWNYQFEHFTFEKNRLSWNFSENPATDQMYITTDENGSLAWVTKGDANNVKDNAVVPAKNLAGVYRRRIQGLGNAVVFMQTSKGMMVCVVFPILLFVMYDAVRRNRYERNRIYAMECERRNQV